MKFVAFELPDQIAGPLENMSDAEKRNSLLRAAMLASSKDVSLEDIHQSIDANVTRSGSSAAEIDRLLDRIS
ncbi:MAG: hypothetical protein MUC38_12285 [Cyclobacteriaceae bacterium]|jgi:hypothetical protein|nr:hypothetical protein [Cyclobacteriaceae bacterium]